MKIIDNSVAKLTWYEQRLLSAPGQPFLELPDMGEYQPIYDGLVARRYELADISWLSKGWLGPLIEAVRTDFAIQTIENMQRTIRAAGLPSYLQEERWDI